MKEHHIVPDRICISCGQIGFADAGSLCWACRKVEEEVRASRPVPPAVHDHRQAEMFR